MAAGRGIGDRGLVGSYSAGGGIWQYASSYDDQGPAGHNFGNTQCWLEPWGMPHLGR
jgi:hypothetical protein